MTNHPLEVGKFYEAPGEVYVDTSNWKSTWHKFVPGEKIQLISLERIYHTIYAKCMWEGKIFTIVPANRLLTEDRMKLRAASLAKK